MDRGERENLMSKLPHRLCGFSPSRLPGIAETLAGIADEKGEGEKRGETSELIPLWYQLTYTLLLS